MSIFYRPSDGVAADFIPFYWDGAYHLFYLKDYRDLEGHGAGTPWWHLETTDFTQFTDWGEAIARGQAEAQDAWVFTGSVIEREGLFHIFYTGHNSHFYHTERPVEAVLHATSPDLHHWTKDTSFTFLAPTGYEKDDWRDPFVFWNAQAGAYWMLLAARQQHVQPSRNRGCVALASSPDLQQWEVQEPFWAPDEYFTHECPDLFRIGDWWYLVYSTFSERFLTHYRMSRSLHGPWLAPANDSFDGRAYYAAKSAGDAQRRYLFGWLPTRVDEKDDGGWQWGGELVVHELRQQPDGTLAVRVPETVLAPFTLPLALAPQPALGSWGIAPNRFRTDATGRFSVLTLGAMPDECLITAEITFADGAYNCGLLLRADATLDSYYQVRLEPASQRLVIDQWPRLGDQPFMLERPLRMSADRPVHLRLLIDGSCVVIYADDQVALSCRLYDHPSGALGLFVTEGTASFDNVTLKGTSKHREG